MNCEVCDKQGFIYGDHPMVKFIDDFLNKNLPQQLENQTMAHEDSVKYSQQNSL